MIDNVGLVLAKMGYEVLTVNAGSARGPDLHVKREGVIFRVEIKKASIKGNTMYVHAVEDLRKHDDLICVIFPSGYVLIEPMVDHLKNCAPCGSRHFFGIY